MIVLFWCAWLLGSWLVCLLHHSPALAARLTMPFAAMVGLLVLWPLIRLTLTIEPGAVAEAASSHLLRQWFYLNFLLQAVLWPLKINARWSLTYTLWLTVVYAAWSLLFALLVAIGIRMEHAAGRAAAMLACLALLLAEPAFRAMTGNAAEPGGPLDGALSPIPLIRRLSTPYVDHLDARHASSIIAVAAAATLGWLLYGLFVRLTQRPAR